MAARGQRRALPGAPRRAHSRRCGALDHVRRRRAWITALELFAQTLRLLAGYDLQALGLNTPGYIHVLTEALKLAFTDGERYCGDPEFVDVPMSCASSGALSTRWVAHVPTGAIGS